MILSGTEHLTLFLANASVCSVLIKQQCHAEKASPPLSDTSSYTATNFQAKFIMPHSKGVGGGNCPC